MYTAIAATAVGEDGLVVAVEMNPEPFMRLVRLIHRSALTNVLAFNVALSDVSGDLVGIEKAWCRNDTAGLMSKGKTKRANAVSTGSLDRLWKHVGSPQVRMAKLDVGGFEPLVIRGGFFAERVSDFALVEISERTMDRVRCHYSTIYESLARLGCDYAYKPENGHRWSLVKCGSNGSNALFPIGNILFSKRQITP